jgi:hypothetical protein
MPPGVANGKAVVALLADATIARGLTMGSFGSMNRSPAARRPNGLGRNVDALQGKRRRGEWK